LPAFAGNLSATSMNQKDDAGQVAWDRSAQQDWTARGTPHYGPPGPSGGDDRVDKEKSGA